MNIEKVIQELENDSKEFFESKMGERILNQEYKYDNYDDVVHLLINLEEPLTETVDRLRNTQKERNYE